MRCIFCLKTGGTFDTVEHLVPASLGGDEVLPHGLVCDQCNNYLGRDVERSALTTPLFTFLRAALCVPNRTGRQVEHQGLGYELFGQNSGTPGAVLYPPKLRRLLQEGNGKFLIPHDGFGAITRLILKMGLEAAALAPELDVYSSSFDSARRAVRAPSRHATWELAGGAVAYSDLREVGEDDEGPFEKRLVFTYEFVPDPTTRTLLFFFVYNWATFLVSLAGANLAEQVTGFNERNTIERRLSISTVSLLDKRPELSLSE
jgi:hypothetical protein